MKVLIEQGGVVIYPLLVASVIALAIIIERFFYFSRIRREIPEKIMQQVKQNLKNGKISESMKLLKKPYNPMYRILFNGILAWEKGYTEMEREMEELKMIVFPRMERRLPMLHFIGKMSPSLGLLGTVTGMIKTFHFLSLNVESQQLAQGISEALITTAFGLSISIPALAAYYYFMNKLEHVVKHTEKRELELIHYVQKLGDRHAQVQD
ncbi:MAG: biopolymer transporter ExbB [Actinobacteria bacterium RBG_13_35_12]|uniref:Biopolymer transporter ExbB n=1 Tax=Candidatus Sediminicultor quintus TaxID=1797291 RepID=A0A1F5A9W8_9BACT|nr:MAG: biopolymer transporter ExbB [Actinobacteria bacterium RBG_13_35_12]OGD15350.1 MAG: biopolymer transporter ExbB [Candidatus Atribacteria bacterium RBG_19FT_COMBO_35_14]